MSAGWEVGDLALCVDDRPNPLYGYCDVVAGRIYVVTGVGEVRPNALLGTSLSLHLAGAISPNNFGFSVCRFRKIRPDEHESCEPEFATLLNRIKHPAKQGEDA